MKIIITESQLKMLTEAASLADDQDFRDTIKSYENEVVDATGKHYVFDDKDPKNPKTFVSSPNKKRGGTLTIGWGHTGPEAKIGAKITKSKAEQLLTADIRNEENKTKNLFPKYDTYPTYVRKALVNSVYRGEAKKITSGLRPLMQVTGMMVQQNIYKGGILIFHRQMTHVIKVALQIEW